MVIGLEAAKQEAVLAQILANCTDLRTFKLSYLTLGLCPPTAASPLDTAYLPNLRYLKYQQRNDPAMTDSAFYRFIRRHLPTLRSLYCSQLLWIDDRLLAQSQLQHLILAGSTTDEYAPMSRPLADSLVFLSLNI